MVGVGGHDGLHLVQGQGDPGGGVGVGEDGEFPLPLHPRYVQGEVLPEGDGLIGHPVEVGKHGVKAVSQGREHRPVGPEGHEGEV